METPSVSGNKNREEDGDEIVTIMDVLNEQVELEEQVNAVLGGADDKICTYSKGYVTRQPLYACATCRLQKNGKLAGVCLACSYRCHEGHELIELYTKRNFRCDCGNSLFPSNKCSLEPEKEAINEKNEYNQNFTGLYCTCKRPYPDPEDTIEDEMIQCILCEDWFHKRHLGLPEGKSSNFDEMICLECMKKHHFLWKYVKLCEKLTDKESEDTSLKVLASDGAKEVKDEFKSESKIEQNKNEKEDNSCVLADWTDVEVGVGSTLWPNSWRKILCQCVKCLRMYEDKKISFLLNEYDPVHYYEAQNQKNAKETQYEQGLKALSSLNRVQVVEAIEGYKQMQTELIEYLQKFAENKKVVRQEDIWEFFDQIKARKKQKVEIPNFCR